MSDDVENDVSEPLYTESGRKLPRTAWPKGHCPNRKGRPKAGTEKSKGKPRSKMRNTLSKVYSLEGIAVENIDKFLHMKEGDRELTPLEKSQLDMSKWVVKTIESLNNTCLREEMAILGIREKNKEDADDLEGNQSVEAEAPKNFSMELVESTLKH